MSKEPLKEDIEERYREEVVEAIHEEKVTNI